MKKISLMRKLKVKLKAIKEKVESENYLLNYRETYNEIFDLCQEYECESGDCKMVDLIQENDILDDDDLQYHLEQNNDDITRLRFFINDTYDADIYKLNGYGNLENVDSSDLSVLCDTLIEQITKSIEDEKQM